MAVPKNVFDDIVDRFLAANPAIRDKGKDQKKLYTVLYEHGRFAKADLARAASASSGAAAASSGAASSSSGAAAGAAGAAAPPTQAEFDSNAEIQAGLQKFDTLSKTKQLTEIARLYPYQDSPELGAVLMLTGKVLDRKFLDLYVAALQKRRKR